MSAGILFSLPRGRRVGDDGLDVYRTLECLQGRGKRREGFKRQHLTQPFPREREGDKKNRTGSVSAVANATSFGGAGLTLKVPFYF